MKLRWSDALVSLSLANLLFWRDWRNVITNSDDGGTEALYLGMRQATSAYYWIPALVLLLAVGIGILLVWLRLQNFPDWINRLGRSLRVLLTLIAPFAALTLGWSVYLGLTPLAKVTPVARGTGPLLQRTLVIVFDEMDEGILFEERDKSFALPALDRFRSENLRASLAFAPSGCTLLSIPALLTGELVTDARAISESDLAVKLADHREHPLSGQGQLFSDASSMGSRTAVVGYFHPYCRLFGRWLESCFSHSSLEFDYGEAPFKPLTFQSPWLERESLAHRRNFQNMSRETWGTIETENFDLVYLHVPLPRPPGVPQPFIGKYSEQAYRANAVFADGWFGALRGRLEKAGLWEKTAIVVTSDHGYRDDARAREVVGPSHRFAHVPLVVKFAGPQPKAAVWTTPLSTVGLRHWVVGMLKGEIRDAAALSRKLLQSPVPPVKTATSTNEYCKLPL